MKRARIAMLAAMLPLLSAALAAPAAAQISLGSPADPPRIAAGVGAFDITPSSSHKDSRTAAEFRGEYRFADTPWLVAPFVGGAVTTDGAGYAYFGLGFDVNFGPSWVLTPNAAAGVFERGAGTRLGSWVEFRTGAELAYRFADLSRLGVAVNHTSNAGLTKRNPGEQSVLLMYSVPVR
ncbi:MAG: acyloxyacyl hydrolase [Thiohalocapsa sp.]